ncbi:MAG: carbohydrate kinase family protein [Spirochaetales bacterium]|jgi:sugar/nucleoside kinase (ribokinase family)|nr:carbohydrate kinase family protein [Spirochaetales bacterium]
MSFIAGAGITNIDLIYSGLPRLPSEGEELFSEGFSVQLGGGVMMTLITLHRLGIPVKAGTWLGKDMFSRFALDEMRSMGLVPENFLTGEALFGETGIPLTVSTAALTPGERTFISYTKKAPPGDTELERMYRLCSGAKAVLMQVGYLDVYRRLKKEGTILVFDMGWDDTMSLAKYSDYLETADYFTPNRKEALKITGAKNPEEAARRLSDYFDRVIVKLDSGGCLVSEASGMYIIPAIPEFIFADSTGAGDAFLAGFLYGIYHHRPFAECVLLGNCTGGKCITSPGCLSAWLTAPELELLAKQYGA